MTEPDAPAAADTSASSDGPPLTPRNHLMVAAGALAIAVALLFMMVFQADRIMAWGLGDRFFYVLLVALGFSVAAFVAGVMRSRAAFKGTRGGLELTVTGPAVFVAVVVIGGFTLVPDGGTRNLAVRVDGPDGGLEGARVTLDAGQRRLTTDTDALGQANFPGLTPGEFAGGVGVRVDAPGFQGARLDLAEYPPGGIVRFDLAPAPVELTGTVQSRDGNAPLAGVVLDFGSGMAVDTTDGLGNFRVTLARPASGRVQVVGTREGAVGLRTEVVLDRAAPLTLLFGGGAP